MTVVELVKMKFCTSCLDFHDQYMKGADFNYAKKIAVTDCRLCEQAMCNDCKASSQKELESDPLCAFGLTMCVRCIMEVRRLTTLHKDYEQIVTKSLVRFKKGIRKQIYSLTQAKYAVSN